MTGCIDSVRRQVALVVLVYLATVGPVLGQPGQTDPRDIVNRIQDIYRGDSSHGVASMEVVTEHWERRITMELWSLGTEHSLIRVRAPRKEAGTATLKADDDIWNYLPKVDRTIKIPASMMGGSWMGSHFTNDDLVQQSRLVDDYDIELTFEGERDGVRLWEMALTPKPEAPVVWGRIEYHVRQDDHMPLGVWYYDEDGDLSRSMVFSDFEDLGGRVVPRTMDMRPADSLTERTTMRYDELEFDIDLDASFFSLRTLQRRR